MQADYNEWDGIQPLLWPLNKSLSISADYKTTTYVTYILVMEKHEINTTKLN